MRDATPWPMGNLWSQLKRGYVYTDESCCIIAFPPFFALWVGQHAYWFKDRTRRTGVQLWIGYRMVVDTVGQPEAWL